MRDHSIEAFEPRRVLRDGVGVFGDKGLDRCLQQDIDHRLEPIDQIDELVDGRLHLQPTALVLDELRDGGTKRPVFAQHLMDRGVLRVAEMAKLGGRGREDGVRGDRFFGRSL